MSALSCFRQLVRTNGVAGLFRGWLPQWARLGPHTVITLVVFEEMKHVMGVRGI